MVAASQVTLEPFFPLWTMTAAVRARGDGALLYELLNRDFPVRTYPILVLEDLPSADPASFGVLGRVWIGNRQGLKVYARSELDAETQSQLVKLLEGLRHESVAAFAVRAADHDASSSKEKFQRTERLEKALQVTSASNAEGAQAALELADRLGPQAGEPFVGLQAALFPGAPDASVATKTASVAAPPAGAPLRGSPPSASQKSQPVRKPNSAASGSELNRSK